MPRHLHSGGFQSHSAKWRPAARLRRHRLRGQRAEEGIGDWERLEANTCESRKSRVPDLPGRNPRSFPLRRADDATNRSPPENRLADPPSADKEQEDPKYTRPCAGELGPSATDRPSLPASSPIFWGFIVARAGDPGAPLPWPGSHLPGLLLVGLLTVLVGGIYLFELLRFRPRRARKALDDARRKIERREREAAAGVPPSPSDYRYSLTFDASGFTIADIRDRKPTTATARWVDVRRATAFKRDLLAVDCICVSFNLADDVELEVDEDMAGWKRLVEVLPEHLPGCKPFSDWYPTVAFPPFATNALEIYVRTNARGT